MFLKTKKLLIIASVLYVTTSLTKMAYASSDSGLKKAAPVYVDLREDEILCTLISGGMRIGTLNEPEDLAPYAPPISEAKRRLLILDAVTYRKDRILGLFLHQGFNPCVLKDDGESLLVRAIGDFNFECAKVLLGSDKLTLDYINHRNGEARETALFLACFNDCSEIVRLLLQKGARRDLCEATRGLSPLMVATHQGHTNCVEALLEGLEGDHLTGYVNYQISSGQTALYFACLKDKVNVVRVLLRKGANRDLFLNSDHSPLMVSSQLGHAECVEALLEGLEGSHLTDYVNYQRPSGMTALYYACHKGKVDVVRLLLRKGARRDLCLNNGYSPLMISSQLGHAGCLDALLEGLEGDALTAVLNYKNPFDGSTALSLALGLGKRDVTAKTLDYGADTPLVGVSEFTLAARVGAVERLKTMLQKAGKNKNKLLNQKITVSVGDKKLAMTTLDAACLHGQIACVKFLLDNGAPYTTNSTGQTESFLWALKSEKPVPTILALFKGLETHEDRRALEICLRYKGVNPEVKKALEVILAAKAPKANEPTRGRATERRGEVAKPKSKKGSEAGAKAGAGGPTVPAKPDHLGDERGGGAWGGPRPAPTPAPKPVDDGPKTVDTEAYLREMEELQAQPILNTLTAAQKQTLVDMYNASKDTDKGSFHGWVISKYNTGRLEGILNPRERSVSVKPSYRERSVSVLGRRGVSKAPGASGGASASAVDAGPGFRLTESGLAITAYRKELAEIGTAILDNFNQALTTLETQGLSGFRGKLKKIESADNNEYEVRLNDGTRLFFKDNGDGSFTIIKRRGNHL